MYADINTPLTQNTWPRGRDGAAGLLRAGMLTLPAAGALFPGPEDLPRESLTLRIVAPQTGKRAAFEKNSGPDSRPVMNTKLLDIENQRRIHFHPLIP
jgi:hypothetical protein